jgi:hypothetical protein
MLLLASSLMAFAMKVMAIRNLLENGKVNVPEEGVEPTRY